MHVLAILVFNYSRHKYHSYTNGYEPSKNKLGDIVCKMWFRAKSESLRLTYDALSFPLRNSSFSFRSVGLLHPNHLPDLPTQVPKGIQLDAVVSINSWRRAREGSWWFQALSNLSATTLIFCFRSMSRPDVLKSKSQLCCSACRCRLQKTYPHLQSTPDRPIFLLQVQHLFLFSCTGRCSSSLSSSSGISSLMVDKAVAMKMLIKNSQKFKPSKLPLFGP